MRQRSGKRLDKDEDQLEARICVNGSVTVWAMCAIWALDTQDFCSAAAGGCAVLSGFTIWYVMRYSGYACAKKQTIKPAKRKHLQQYIMMTRFQETADKHMHHLHRYWQLRVLECSNTLHNTLHTSSEYSLDKLQHSASYTSKYKDKLKVDPDSKYC